MYFLVELVVTHLTKDVGKARLVYFKGFVAMRANDVVHG
jgi:hypothetical protein